MPCRPPPSAFLCLPLSPSVPPCLPLFAGASDESPMPRRHRSLRSFRRHASKKSDMSPTQEGVPSLGHPMLAKHRLFRRGHSKSMKEPSPKLPPIVMGRQPGRSLTHTSVSQQHAICVGVCVCVCLILLSSSTASSHSAHLPLFFSCSLSALTATWVKAAWHVVQEMNTRWLGMM